MTQIFRAALFTLLCGLSYGVGLMAAPGIAHAQIPAAGSACAPNGTTAVSANVDGHINLLYCKSGSWAASSLVAGASLETCNAAVAGIMKWSGTAMQYCNGTDWADFAGSCTSAFSCGQAGGSVSISAPSTVNLCSTGTSTAVTTNATNHTWRCNHNNLTADCTALRLVCGAAHNGTPVKTPPTSNLCVNGTASAITTNSATQTYNWSCDNAGLSTHCMVLNGNVGPTIVATGATKTSSGNYDIYSFSGNGTFNINALGLDPAEGDRIEYLLVGGGGGGGSGRNGNYGGAGGGGGGMLSGTKRVHALSYTVRAGLGGAGGALVSTWVHQSGDSGANSSIEDSYGFGVTAIGGGGGTAAGLSTVGKDGGSGGGTAIFIDTSYVAQPSAPGQGTAGQGYAGGNPYVNSGSATSGGGGGAGGVGQDGVDGRAGDGGVGRVSSITGSAVYYAGGGGGGVGRGAGAVGGNGGGGDASSIGSNGKGGGGGGGGTGSGANGGSGIVVIKVRKP